MKILSIVLRILMVLVLLMPVLGTVGVFPPATADMFTPAGWAYMSALMETGYMMPVLGLLSFVCAILFLIGRTALGAIVVAPFTFNVMLFHWFLDDAPVSSAAIPAYVLLVLNLYFLWENRKKYKALW